VKRPTLIVLGLAVLLALALLFHRDPRAVKPSRPPRPAATADPAAPDPTAIAVANDPPKPQSRVAPNPAEIPPVLAEAIAPGTVRGVVSILGVPPRRRKARLEIDPNCAALHTGDLLLDDIVVDPANNVHWAFVYVARGNTTSPPGPLPPVLLDQVGCRFDPHVLGVRVNQPINIWNNDRLLHTVHSLPYQNKEFNRSLPEFRQVETKSFSKPEVMIKIKCDIHPWMAAWVGVLDHPYFSVTSETGNYGIVNLPPGRFLIKVWHELYAAVEREVEIPSGGDVRLDFYLDTRKAE
jgi:hypothetical protein